MVPGLGPIGIPNFRLPRLLSVAPEAMPPGAPPPPVSVSKPVQLTVIKDAPKPDSWKRKWQPEIIYFPLTDRFKDGDATNNFEVDRTNPVGFHGGDLRGLIDSLDYLQDLGVSTIWVSPLADNTNFAQIDSYRGTGYHGYWIKDHYKVEEHQGTLETVKELVDKAHEKKMKVVLDVVLNHVGPDHPFASDPSKRDWFHTHGVIRDWENPHEIENGNVGGLPDLAQENPAVYDYLLKNTLWWIEQTGADGIRLDAVKHIPKWFWERFSADIKKAKGDDFLLLGEVLHGDPNIQAPYQRGGLDALFDIPLYYTLREVFAEGQSAERLGQRLDEDSKYPDATKLVTLLDNHDFPRFMNSAGPDGRQRLKLALAFLMTVRGIPSVYYGTEVAMNGGHDPDNRQMMKWGSDPDMVDHFKKLTALRKGHEALQFGTQYEMWRDPQVYAFARRYEGREVVAVFNNASEPQSRDMLLRSGSPLKEGTVLEDALSGETFTVRHGRLDVALPAKTARILVAKR